MYNPSFYNNLRIDRYTEIEKENRLLLEKMSNIMQSQKGTQCNYLGLNLFGF